MVVSHSAALAAAAVDLAAQMVPAGGPVVAVAAGTADGGLGTDATEVADAFRTAASPDGVLVLMDLGSAVLSAELALELSPPEDHEVRLSSAPLVEGLVAAVVRAAGGADLATVQAEAEDALRPKAVALAPAGDAGGVEQAPSDGVRLVLTNPQGLHARPAALVAAAVGDLDAEVRITHDGRSADAASSLELMTLGAAEGAEIVVSASGADAEAAVRAISALVADGFGET
nr:dihydroxyacetone kinase phosphoryl donor subunit DhaM [Nocardioides sp. 1609]